MSKTDKTDPFWVKHNNASSYAERHRCSDFRGGIAGFPCDLPASPLIERPNGERTWRTGRPWQRCTWQPRWHRGDWNKSFARWGGEKYHRKDWYSKDRSVNRRSLREMKREARSGFDIECLSEDALDLRSHRHTPLYGGGWLD